MFEWKRDDRRGGEARYSWCMKLRISLERVEAQIYTMGPREMDTADV